ncbi:hypothetical protein DFJ43DRAFT_1156756 [Lentinula guzmanii]|uniref:Uncharacterized protein n=1 Tax=Lentinula guzmanii TaxID=2804957 RepID=A0AA38MY63_9AGAR|nr:hypothetical protein DFJ43DRAFT_1156756 [Lentinula guzmanii]
MPLRADTFFPTLFVSLLFIVSTFAIPISRDSNSHGFFSDVKSPKLVDCDVVPQLIDARADALTPSSGSILWPLKPLEARVLLQCNSLPKEDLTALKSAIEKMLSPALLLLKGTAIGFVHEERLYEDVKAITKMKAIPITEIECEPSLGEKLISNTEYQFKFALAGQLEDFAYHFEGYPYNGTINRASLSNGGKKLTGSVLAHNRLTGQTDVIVSFTNGKSVTQSRFATAMVCLGAEWIHLKQKLGIGKNLEIPTRCSVPPKA